MAKQRPTDSGLPRRQPGRALSDAHDESVVATRGPICGHRGRHGGIAYMCAKNPGHLGNHTMVREDGVVSRYLETSADDTLVPGTTDVLAAAPPSGAQVADPTHDTPDESGDASETGGDSPGSAGSGSGGSGRPSIPASALREVSFDESPDDSIKQAKMVPYEESNERRSLVRPDASEKVLGAAMAVVNPTADPAFAIRHAEEQARVLIIGQHWADMLKAVSPPAAQLVAEEDVRGMYHYLRLIAATHGIDLDGGDQ